MTMKRKKNPNGTGMVKESIFCYITLIILAILCVVPLLLVVSASVTSEESIVKYGYSLIPKDFSLGTYQYMLTSKLKMFMKAYGMTIAVTVLGTLFSVSVTACFAWAVTQKKEVFRPTRFLSFYAWFTTIFSGGVLSWYILCTQYYGLKNNIFALFIPYGMSVWNMFILRGAFRGVSTELIESAQLDGASNALIFRKIVLPLARAGIVTVVMFDMLRFWNDFHLPQWLVTDSDYYTLQKLLYNMLASTMFLLQNSQGSNLGVNVTVPAETAKMAVAVLAILPIIMIYPFSLRYFVKGINLGGVKG